VRSQRTNHRGVCRINHGDDWGYDSVYSSQTYQNKTNE
jgi:hypothetical protein